MDSATRQQFLDDYQKIRYAEGRGSADPAYYQALPYKDLTGRNASQWEIRGRSYRHFERHILTPAERAAGRALRILDLGAGTGWMSWRLGLRGHKAVAVDIFTDPLDGLGAAQKFPVQPEAVAAEFDQLPFADESIDLAVYNSSIHYSSDYAKTLSEARRVLKRDGMVVILDSPCYSRQEHGQRMREERQEFFLRTHGFRSEALRSIEYLDEGTLATLSRELGITWNRSYPWYGWKWAWRPWRARLKRQRPPSQFFVLSGRFGR